MQGAYRNNYKRVERRPKNTLVIAAFLVNKTQSKRAMTVTRFIFEPLHVKCHIHSAMQQKIIIQLMAWKKPHWTAAVSEKAHPPIPMDDRGKSGRLKIYFMVRSSRSMKKFSRKKWRRATLTEPALKIIDNTPTGDWAQRLSNKTNYEKAWLCFCVYARS